MTEVVGAAPVTMVMSETVVTETIENQPEPVSSVLVQETNGVTPTVAADKANGNNTTAPAPAVSNGDAKKKEKVVPPAEPPKDPKVDPLGWVKQQTPAAIHKVNYYLLDWMQKHVVEDETKRQPLPGKNETVTRKQFLGYLQNGSVLAHLANKLSPGSVESIHEGEAVKEKPNQVANVQAFINFVKEKAGFPEDQVFTVEDLQEKGKAGYEAVFNTLFQLAMTAHEKFNQTAIDVDRVAEEAKNTIPQTIVQSIINFFKKVAPSSSGKQVAQQGDKTATTTTDEPTSPANAGAAAPASDKVIEEVQEQVNKVEVTATPASIVVSESVVTAAN